MNGVLLVLLIIFIYIIAVYFISKRFKKKLERVRLGFWGPFLLWRTVRGKRLIERLAKYRRFWRAYGNVAIGVVFIFMFMMMGMIILAAYSITIIPQDPVPPETILVLPGLNPLIPLWYGLISLIIAVVIHEFAHGILSRVAYIEIKSLGVVFFIVPVGAFVEPNEDKLRNTSKIKRDRVFSVGPATNIFVALICAMIFAWGFMGSLDPVEDGVLILSVSEDYPADEGGIKPGMIIIHIQGNTTNGSSLGEAEINSREDFTEFMEKTSSNDTVNITAKEGKKIRRFSDITLVDKGEYYPEYEDFQGKGFLGVSSVDTNGFINSLAYPVRSAEGDRSVMVGNIITFGLRLPFNTAIMPFHEPLTDVYEVKGPLSAMPEPLFWGLANLFYYLFWLNMLLGVFNALPAVPLDGGYPYRDAWDTIINKLRPHLNEEEREMKVNIITVYTSLFIFFLFLWLIIGPYFR